MTISVAAALRCRGCNELHYLNDDQLCLDCSDKAQEATVPKPKPIYALPTDDRRRAARQFTGYQCAIEIRPFRDNDNAHNHTVLGVVTGVAIPNVGTFADQLIVRVAGEKYLRSLSLATVYSITIQPPAANGAAEAIARTLQGD